MPEIFPTQKGSDPLFADKTAAELDAMLNSMTPEGDIALPEETPVEPAPPAEPEPVVEAAAPEPEVPADSEPTPDEIEVAASVIEGERLAREKLEAKLAMLEAHNSRLAGKLGFVEQQLKSAPPSTEPYQPETQEELDRLTAVERRLAASDFERAQVRVSQVIESELGALDGTWTTELAEEIAAIAPKYADQIKAVQDSGDPELARQTARAVGLLVKAEATQMRWDVQHKALVEKRASSAPGAISAKKATAPSGSGSVPASAPKPKTVADMTAAEADAWLRENVL